MTLSTVPAVLDDLARERADEAAITVIGGEALTFEAWRLATCRMARALREDLGVRPGERVLVSYGARNWPDFAIGYVGVQRAGGVPVPVVQASGQDLLAEIAVAAHAVACVGAGPGGLPRVTAAQLASHSAAPIDYSDVDEVADIVYTSGTTGRPKGVAASYATALASSNRKAEARPQVILHATPPGTSYGQMQLLSLLSAAPYRMVVAPLFNPRAVLEAVAEQKVTTLALVPTTARMLIDALPTVTPMPDVSSVRLIRLTGSYIDPHDLGTVQDAFPHTEVDNVYSTTEALPAVVRARYSRDRPGSVGLPSAGSEVRVVDEQGAPVPAGTLGSIEMRCDGARRWYVDGEAELEVFRDDGWVCTNDLGLLDNDGYLYITDRKRDVLSIGGLKVGTVSIESALRAHPAVRDVAVIGIAHRPLGEVPVACVVGQKPDIDTAAVLEYGRKHLEHLAPHDVMVVDQIPVNAMGKPDKKVLRRRYELQQLRSADEYVDGGAPKEDA